MEEIKYEDMLSISLIYNKIAFVLDLNYNIELHLNYDLPSDDNLFTYSS